MNSSKFAEGDESMVVIGDVPAKGKGKGKGADVKVDKADEKLKKGELLRRSVRRSGNMQCATASERMRADA